MASPVQLLVNGNPQDIDRGRFSDGNAIEFQTAMVRLCCWRWSLLALVWHECYLPIVSSILVIVQVLLHLNRDFFSMWGVVNGSERCTISWVYDWRMVTDEAAVGPGTFPDITWSESKWLKTEIDYPLGTSSREWCWTLCNHLSLWLKDSHWWSSWE